MLTLARIEELRQLENMAQGEEINITDEEWRELLDAALAWALYAQQHGIQSAKWQYDIGRRLWQTYEDDAYESPQAAVLAALRKKGATDAK